MQIHKILLVDDDPEDRDLMIDALAELGAHDMVTCADHGEDALKLLTDLNAPSTYPCLIILDLNMPKMNGRQTLDHLKADHRFKDIPVIIYSTSVNPLEEEACMMLGAKSYITKPISYKESLETAQLFLQFCTDRSLA
jgi:CheY-like chemotaxis protein